MGVDTALFLYLHGLSGRFATFEGIVVFLAVVLLPLMLIVVGFWMYNHKRHHLFTLGLALVFTLLVELLIHQIYFKPRPFITFDFVPLLLPGTEGSFPSNHAGLSFAIAQVGYFARKKLGYYLFGFAFLVSVSRIVAGVHYPSDIIFGALLGVGLAFVAKELVQKVHHE